MRDPIKIPCKTNANVVLKAVPGHFVTPNSHVNYFLDMTNLKHRLSEASATAKALSEQIVATTVVDTIVCMDGCEIIGAFLAEDLTRAGIYSMNAHKTIYIVTPEFVNTNQLMFRENYIPMIKGKNILLLLDSATTGKTVAKAVQTLSYYGATISGISAVFSIANSIMGVPIKSLFNISDLPDYMTSAPEACSLCKDGIRIDAFANGYGYSVIHE
ncbi:MAG: orotate phosphoribosyltransferase [Acetatifactor sp.]|nr:orotate phosphoribosyltransferase [Acetatifactor sp.]